MTPTSTERAQKILDMHKGAGFFAWTRDKAIAEIAQEIEAACVEARRQGLIDGQEVYMKMTDKAKAIRREAIEECANEVRSYLFETGKSVELLDLANRIEALLPGEKEK